MDFGTLLVRAWAITRRWKVLWILGFLAALAQGTGAANSGYRFIGQQFPNGGLPSFNPPPGVEALLIGLACLALLAGIVLWLVALIARGGLIAGVVQVEAAGSTSLGRAWAIGQSRFWTLFGIAILVALPVIIIILAMALGSIVVAWGAAVAAGRSANGGMGSVIGALFVCLCPATCLLMIAGVVLGQIRVYAERAAILEGRGWIDAFGRGWQVLLSNLGPTIVLWLIFLLLDLIVGALVVAIFVPVVVPLSALFGGSRPDAAPGSAPYWLLLAPICGLSLVAIVVGAFVNSVLNTFTSAAWTLAYRQMTAPPAAPVPLAAPAPPIPPAGPLVEG